MKGAIGRTVGESARLFTAMRKGPGSRKLTYTLAPGTSSGVSFRARTSWAVVRGIGLAGLLVIPEGLVRM